MSRRPVSYIIRIDVSHLIGLGVTSAAEQRARVSNDRARVGFNLDRRDTSATMCKANYYYFECLGNICNHLVGGGRKTGSIDGETLTWATTRGHISRSLFRPNDVSLCAWPLNLPFLRRLARATHSAHWWPGIVGVRKLGCCPTKQPPLVTQCATSIEHCVYCVLRTF